MNKHRYGLVSFLVCAIVVMLSGCGGGSSNNNVDVENQGTTQVISGKLAGYIRDDASIVIKDLQNKQLAEGEAEANGAYSISIDNLTKQNLNIQISQLNGDVTETFQHLLLADDDWSNVNISVLTTIVSGLLDSSSGTLKEERINILQKLEEIGLLDTATWLDPEPETLSSETLLVLREENQLSQWMSDVVNDAVDYDLKPENMVAFPNAHGGIYSISSTEDVAINVLENTQTKAELIVHASESKDNYFVEVLVGDEIKLDLGEDNSWVMNIDANLVNGDKQIPYSIRAYNKTTNKGRLLAGVIHVHKGNILADGVIPRDGGRLQTDDGQYGIEIPAGQLSEDIGVKIISAKNEGAEEIISFEFDREISDGLKVKWVTPFETESHSEKREKQTLKKAEKNTEYLIRTKIAGGYAWVYKGEFNNARLYSDIVGYGEAACSDGEDSCQEVVIQKKKSWQLLREGKLTVEESSQPVLFIHGYRPGILGFGGGEDTWGQFPELISRTTNIKNSNGEYVSFIPYEFQWRTNTKFEIAADDLSKAIHEIYLETGKKVLVVAHSFGGVLVRTMVQQNETNSINSLVSGVVSLGTPYSGVSWKQEYIDEYDLTLPQGYDSTFGAGGAAAHSLCKQISCFQMGDYINGFSSLTNEFSRVISLTQRETAWPENIPLSIGIGFREEYFGDVLGDGLISINGQRFDLDDGLVNGNLLNTSNIKERIIGIETNVESIPVDTKLLDYEGGYAHISFLATRLVLIPDRKPARKEALVDEKLCGISSIASSCQHGSYKLVHSAFGEYLKNETTGNPLTLIKPAGLNSSVFGSKVKIDWSTVGSASKYKVYFSHDPDFLLSEAFGSEESTVSHRTYNLPPDDVGCEPIYYRVTAINLTGESQPSNVDVITPPCVTLSGYIRDGQSGEPIPNAIVRLELEKNIEKTVQTDANGFYTLEIPTYTNYIGLQVEADGYQRSLIQVKKDNRNHYGFVQQDLTLQKLDDSIVQIDEGNSIYHLGDDSYSGTINSQLQLSSLGLSQTLSFRVTQEQLSKFSYARLKFSVRGAQNDNPIQINSTRIGHISSSRSDGSFGRYYWNIDMDVLLAGENSFSISSALRPYSSDHDDFEFTNVVLYLYETNPDVQEKVNNSSEVMGKVVPSNIR